MSKLSMFIQAFTPLGKMSAYSKLWLKLLWLGIFCTLWMMTPAIFPRPWEILLALFRLLRDPEVIADFASSLLSNAQALVIATTLSLGVSWLALVPFFRPPASVLTLLRFLSLAGITLLFTVILGGGQVLKVSLLVFVISANFITSMLSCTLSIPREEFDQARVLNMKPWRMWWEIVVRGTLDKAFVALGQNAAIGWMMLTGVESIVRNTGGIGKIINDANKQWKLENVYAMVIMLVIIGFVQDKAIAYLKRIVCPYASLTTEEK